MSLAATILNSIRVKNDRLDKNEHRLSEYGAFDFFVQQSKTNPLLTEEMRTKAIDSMGKTLQMPVITYDGVVSVSNVRSCTVTDAENTSSNIPILSDSRNKISNSTNLRESKVSSIHPSTIFLISLISLMF